MNDAGCAGAPSSLQGITLKDCIRRIREIEILTQKTVSGIQSGAHRSLFGGQGIEFIRIREYVPGDDIRAFDWNVTARLGHPFVREFSEDRDRTVCFVIDRSASGTFGTHTSKELAMLDICASLMFAALHNNDAIGMCIVTDDVETFISARKGRRHCLHLLNTLITHVPRSAGTDLETALAHLIPHVPRRCSIVLISDFASPDFAAPLTFLSRRHDLSAVVVSDPGEYTLPDIGLVEFADPETGGQFLADTSDPAVRERFDHLVGERTEALGRIFHTSGTRAVSLSTGEPYIDALKSFFGARRGGA